MTPSQSFTVGMHDVIATTSAVSAIDGGSLSYRGINIDELAEHATFEEVIYLLWHSRLPTAPECAQLREQIATSAVLPHGVLDLLRSFPRRTTPMEVLRSAVGVLGMFDAEAEDRSAAANGRKAIRLVGQIASIVAAYDRIRNDRQPVAARPDLSLAANFLYMQRGLMPDSLAVRALDKAYIVHADHELNASTFAARIVAGALSDLYSCVTAAICALKGPLHGGANELVMRMLNDIGTADRVDPYIRKKLADREKIMGFGHPIYKGGNGDPRAKHLKELSRQLGKLTNQEQWYLMSARIEEIVAAAKHIRPNVDFYSASVFHYLNLRSDLFTPIFTISRTSGWVAHCLEQYEFNKLMRPRAEYTGLRDQHWVPMEKR